MQTHKTHADANLPGHYYQNELLVRDLFPNLDKSKPYDEQRDYIEQRLVALAEAKDISVVELMNQPDDWKTTLAGQVILGEGINTEGDGNPYTLGWTVPRQVAEYRIKVRQIEYERVLHPDDPDRKGGVTVRMETRPISWRRGFKFSGYIKRNRGRVKRSSPVTEQVEGKEATLSLSDVWRCLAQAGKWCRKLNAGRLRRRGWYYEEVNGAEGRTQSKRG